MKRILSIILFLFFSSPIFAGNNDQELSTAYSPIRHFMWGIDFGSTIDLSGNDMSSIDFDAYFGYKNDFFRALGLGASIHSAIGNDYTFFPVYILLRTSFTSRPSLCFFDMRLGYSFNNLSHNESQSSPFASAGIGFNLYCSRKFKSHIILAYNFLAIKNYTVDSGETYKFNNINGASIRIGINF